MKQVSEIIYIRRKPYTNPLVKELDAFEDDSKWKIGSAITSSGYSLKGLSPQEEKLYLPDILGTSPESPDWNKETESYWRGISVPVPVGPGLKLEIGMIYQTDEDAKARKNGTPINTRDYILFRYCSVYRRVANSIDDVYKSKHIRFYMHSESAQLAKEIDKFKLSKDAMKKYVEVVDDESVVESLLRVLEPSGAIDVSAMISSKRQMTLHSIVTDRPSEFLKAASDPKLKVKATIRELISLSVLRIIPNTENIVYGENTRVGDTLDDAVVFFENDLNKPKIDEMIAQARAKRNHRKVISTGHPSAINN